jgi:hypothetical protein
MLNVSLMQILLTAFIKIIVDGAAHQALALQEQE